MINDGTRVWVEIELRSAKTRVLKSNTRVSKQRCKIKHAHVKTRVFKMPAFGGLPEALVNGVSVFSKLRKTREGWICRFREGGHKGGSVDPIFAAGLPFPVPEIPRDLKHLAIRETFSAIFPEYSRNFPLELPN